VLVDKDTVRQLQEESTDVDEETGVKRLATLINTEYKPNMDKEEVYQPLHSGKYKKILENGKQIVIKQMVETIPDYIKVRKLVKLTDEEKQQKEAKRQQAIQKAEQDKIKKEQEIQKAKDKFLDLGLTETEIKSFIP
jgi:hypothetical protein